MADSQPKIPPSATQFEAIGGIETADRLWSPFRVSQAIAALETGGGGGGGGWIVVTDVTPTSSGSVGNKTYQTPANAILVSCQGDTLNLDVTVVATGPRVRINTTDANLTKISGESHFIGTVSITVGGTGNIVARQILPDGSNGASMETAYTYQTGPTILTCTFTGGYPGSQTELKAGDTFQITGTTDTAADSIDIIDYGAFTSSFISITEGTSFTVTGTIADRGLTTQALPARVRARNSALAFGPTFDTDSAGSTDGVHLVNLNNTYPTATIGAITYPGGQSALKGSELGSVAMTTSDFDTINYTSPNGDLAIANSTLDEPSKTVQRISGSYNDSTPNFQVAANRAANDATTTNSTVVVIANVAPTVSVVLPASRLRSGGNDGTSVQTHTIILSSDQWLAAAPSMSEDTGGGTFTGSWSWSPTAKSFSRDLDVHDNDVKGSYTWQSFSATGLSGLVTTTLSGSTSYTLGGFVQRDVTFAAFSQTTTINVEVIDYSKLTAGTFTSTNQPSNRNPVQGDTSDIVDTYTVTALAANPTTVFWNDQSAANANSSGTAQLLNIEETV